MEKPASSLFDGDLRRHRRMPVDIPGRFMRADKTEHDCRLKDISVGGARLASSAPVDVGETVVAYFDDLGGLRGMVTRVVPEGFAFQYSVSEHKREKLAAQIMWLANRDDFPAEAQRAHTRVSSNHRTTLKLEDGIIIDVELIDRSASGASVRTSARPRIGALVLLGSLEAIVRRHHPHGIGVQFVNVQEPDGSKRGV